MSEFTKQVEQTVSICMDAEAPTTKILMQLLRERALLVEALHGIHNDSLSHIGCLSRAEKALKQVGELP